MKSLPLIIATTNPGKLEEFRLLLSSLFDCHPFAPLSVKENGTSYRENALKKAFAYFKSAQLPTLADDSGLEIDALGSRPGIESARYGGEALSFPERWELLWKELKNVHHKKWHATFRCVLCYVDSKQDPHYFEGITRGLLLPSPAGKGGFGYDPIFYSDELCKSFGDATSSEKQLASHRAKACQQFLHWANANLTVSMS